MANAEKLSQSCPQRHFVASQPGGYRLSLSLGFSARPRAVSPSRLWTNRARHASRAVKNGRRQRAAYFTAAATVPASITPVGPGHGSFRGLPESEKAGTVTFKRDQRGGA